MKHLATSSKDRTSLFADQPDFKITPATGKQILAWCEQGDPVETEASLETKISNCTSLPELVHLFNSASPARQLQLHQKFTEKKQLLQATGDIFKSINHLTNGTN